MRSRVLSSTSLAIAWLLLAAAPGTVLAQSSITYPGGAGPGQGKHVVFLSGDEEYRSEEALPMLAKILSQRHGFRSTVLFALDPDGTINPKNTRSLPDSTALDSADLIVMMLRYRQWPDDAMARFEAAVRRGVPIVAIRTSTHAFHGFPAESRWARWNENNQGGFGRQVFGETWVTHWGRHKVEATRGVVEPGQEQHPLLRGVERLFVESDVYEAHPPADVTVLVRGIVLETLSPDAAPTSRTKTRATDRQPQPINDPAMPVVWTREYRNEAGTTNRILLSTMGSATDFENEGLRRLIVNGVFWGLGLNVPARADVTYVDPYRPSFFGFDAFRKGLKVSDFALGKAMPGDPVGRP
jgi:type 1 glutamine amidotransferase